MGNRWRLRRRVTGVETEESCTTDTCRDEPSGRCSTPVRGPVVSVLTGSPEEWSDLIDGEEYGSSRDYRYVSLLRDVRLSERKPWTEKKLDRRHEVRAPGPSSRG